MINNIKRLIEVADDMEKIRPKEDVFKICYIITCIDTLYKITEKNKELNNNKFKIVIDFFENYISIEDKKFISENFIIVNDFFEKDTSREVKKIITENFIDELGNFNNISLFASMLNEIRNIATHEGDYWDTYFNNHKESWLTINYKKIHNPNANSFIIEYEYNTKISYDEFKKIFIRGCIEFVGEYIKDSSLNSE